MPRAAAKHVFRWTRTLSDFSPLSLAGQTITSEKLAATSAFLRWTASGHLQCAEDGNHHRPNRPAEVSRDIFINMEQVRLGLSQILTHCLPYSTTDTFLSQSQVAGLNPLYGKHGTPVSSVERQLMRHLHPWLPSFSSEFTCSVPMTRIRDIAHRNDIPQDLKVRSV